MNDNLTRAGLIDALFEGLDEQPLWATFLDRVRAATGADYAGLILHLFDRPFEEAIRISSGGDQLPGDEDAYRRHFARRRPQRDLRLTEGRAMAPSEMFSRDDPLDASLRDELVEQFGIAGLRQIRVREVNGVDAVLSITRRDADFTDDVLTLLEELAPILRGMLRIHVRMERERFVASLTSQAVRRLQFGWLTLDATGCVLDCDEQGAAVLATSGILGRNSAGKLTASAPNVEREVYQALARITAGSQSRARAITLCRDPWLDMLIMPSRQRSIAVRSTPTAIAYVHGDSWASTKRSEQLAELFSLSPREARLALALSRGMTLAEAAKEFGLTIQTVRTYSKAIFAKTGARGQPDLVRIVMRSVLAIAPEA